ncbi:hypothetical protein [Salinisphaera sp. G21_0]|uniref:hypothetical protein n=1 Tax=Salinisphaera sp. G21_0 TaxID=2821094 RepID=UPI001ADBDA71|nr:hypothetical protein [Salinisphaera sp. G21_0]MBO9480589.1 hypothetical protein [Salinisphaera sp. G21_0]
MLDPTGNNDTVYTTPLTGPTSYNTAPPSYNAVMAEMAQESATFNQSLTTVNQKVDALVLTAAAENNCQAHQIVRPLIDHLIERFQLTVTQLQQVSTAARNPNEPDNWNWDQWQKKHYVPSWSGKDCFSPKSKEKVNRVILALHDQISSDGSFKTCQNLPYVKEQFGLGAAQESKDFLDLSQLFSQTLKPLTPFIRQCIAAGLFTKNFINKLYAM